MQPLLIKPETLDADSAATWAWYGAAQMLQMLGLSYREAATASADEALVIDPIRGQFCLKCCPSGSCQDVPATELLRVTHYATFRNDATGGQVDLPVLGTPRPIPPGYEIGKLNRRDDDVLHGPFLSMNPEGAGAWRLHFSARLSATIGLYLSRFSWPGNSTFNAFVRDVDSLWDNDLRARWGRQAVVNEYLQIIAGILCGFYAELGLPMPTAWQHPVRDGQVMRHGLIITHDVDQLFSIPEYRHSFDQTGNNRFWMPRWRELEDELGVKSAYYFYSPHPERTYWFEPNYSVGDPVVLDQIKAFRDGGWEVSLHQMSHETADVVIAENEFFKQATGEASTGTRSHYLKHTFDTLNYKVQAGLRYDSTWYSEQTTSDFLCGCALPYQPLDCRSMAPVGLWEFPFVLEDGNVFGVYGENTARDVAGAVADGAVALDQILAHDGYACLNWHTYNFEDMPAPAPSWPPAMAGLVRYMQEHSPALWTPLPIELADWWSRRAAISLEIEPGKLIVRNEGPEDCDDFVVCLQYNMQDRCPAPQPEALPGGAQPLGQRGSRMLFGLPVSVRAGETIEIELPRL